MNLGICLSDPVLELKEVYTDVTEIEYNLGIAISIASLMMKKN